MKASLGVEPKYNAYIKDSRMCGSCHTINLPVMDQKPFGHSLEQVTYLEWLNSEFQTDFNPGPNAQSCQACHMTGSYANARAWREHQADSDRRLPTCRTTPIRPPSTWRRWSRCARGFETKGFVRHQLQGLNVFLLEMFNRFMEPDTSTPPNYSNDILGVRKSDYMSTLYNDLPNAIANFVQTARAGHGDDGGTRSRRSRSQTLSADVRITNRTGHRLPSGVGFRRAFIEFVVMDNRSHRSGDRAAERRVVVGPDQRRPGVIVDGQGNAACRPSTSAPQQPEGTRTSRTSTAADVPSPSSTQVQIFEELMQGRRRQLHDQLSPPRQDHQGQPPAPEGMDRDRARSGVVDGEFLHSTFPEGDAAKDPSYMDGSGTSLVRYDGAAVGAAERHRPVEADDQSDALLPIDPAVLPDAAVRTGAECSRPRSGSST